MTTMTNDDTYVVSLISQLQETLKAALDPAGTGAFAIDIEEAAAGDGAWFEGFTDQCRVMVVVTPFGQRPRRPFSSRPATPAEEALVASAGEAEAYFRSRES